MTTGQCGGTGKEPVGQGLMVEVGCKKDQVVGCVTVAGVPFLLRSQVGLTVLLGSCLMPGPSWASPSPNPT